MRLLRTRRRSPQRARRRQRCPERASANCTGRRAAARARRREEARQGKARRVVPSLFTSDARNAAGSRHPKAQAEAWHVRAYGSARVSPESILFEMRRAREFFGYSTPALYGTPTLCSPHSRRRASGLDVAELSRRRVAQRVRLARLAVSHGRLVRREEDMLEVRPCFGGSLGSKGFLGSPLWRRGGERNRGPGAGERARGGAGRGGAPAAAAAQSAKRRRCIVAARRVAEARRH